MWKGEKSGGDKKGSDGPDNPGRRKLIGDILKYTAGGLLIAYGVDKVFLSRERLAKTEKLSEEDFEDNEKYPPMEWGEGSLSWEDIKDSSVEDIIKKIKTPSEVASLFSKVNFYVKKSQSIAQEYKLRSTLKERHQDMQIPRIPYVTLEFKEWLTTIKSIAREAEVIERYWDKLDIGDIEKIFRKYRPEDNGGMASYSEGASDINSPLYRIYAEVILKSDMSGQEKSDALAALLEDRNVIPYESALPESYIMYDRTRIEAMEKEETLQEMERIYSVCQSITEHELPICRDASKAVELLLHDNGYPPVVLTMRSKTEFNKGHVVYLVKSKGENGNNKYGYIGFNEFEGVRPEFDSIKELFEAKFSKRYKGNYEILDHSKVIDSFK